MGTTVEVMRAQLDELLDNTEEALEKATVEEIDAVEAQRLSQDLFVTAEALLGDGSDRNLIRAILDMIESLARAAEPDTETRAAARAIAAALQGVQMTRDLLFETVKDTPLARGVCLPEVAIAEPMRRAAVALYELRGDRSQYEKALGGLRDARRSRHDLRQLNQMLTVLCDRALRIDTHKLPEGRLKSNLYGLMVSLGHQAKALDMLIHTAGR